jgi:DNA-binding transcriptional LysR family regulator
MRDPGHPSLEQLRVFLAVIDHGGFAHAARALHRTQSVISYTIANLEDQLNIPLLDRSKRKPTLTDAGRALLADARTVLSKVDAMRARAKALGQGLEAEVCLVVDVMFPGCVLVQVLEAFQREFPTVSLRLHMEALGTVTQMVQERRCQLGISGMPISMADVIERHIIGEIEMVPVCAPKHALAKIDGVIPTTELREHLQLVVTDRSTLTQGQDFGVVSRRDWRLGDVSSKHALLRGGIGWGNMPMSMVAQDLKLGWLVRLQLQDSGKLMYPLYALHRADEQLGPAASWLRERFIGLDLSLPHEPY